VQELAKKAAFAVVKAANGEVEFEVMPDIRKS
jgi:hypothetical protein